MSYFWATRPRFTFRDAVLALNVVSLGLVITSLVQIISQVRETGRNRYVAAKNAPVQELTRPESPPDVYYFILDSYGRADLLEQAYGYDNSEFLQGLEERGFFVADREQRAGCACLDLERRLVGLDREERLPERDVVTLGLQPLDDPELVARRAERRHANRAGHD